MTDNPWVTEQIEIAIQLATLVYERLKPQHMSPHAPAYLALTDGPGADSKSLGTFHIGTNGDPFQTTPAQHDEAIRRANTRIEQLRAHPFHLTSHQSRLELPGNRHARWGGGTRTPAGIGACSGLTERFDEALELVRAVHIGALDTHTAMDYARLGENKPNARRLQNPYFPRLLKLWNEVLDARALHAQAEAAIHAEQ